MAKRVICFVLLAIVTLWLCGGCGDTAVTDYYHTYSDEAISFQYPDWPDQTAEEKEIFIFKSNGTEVFTAARYQVPPEILKQELVKNLGAEIDGEYAYYVLDPDGAAMQSVTRILYSNYETYALSLAGPETPDKSLLTTAMVKTRELNTLDGVGIMPLPANDDVSLLGAACREARSLGAEYLDYYFFWGWMADDWSVADHIMSRLSHEGKAVAVMNVIHTNVLAEYPPEYEHFADPGFKEDFAAFSVEFVERYQPEYYFIGGEVDIYLSEHRDEIAAFQEVLGYAYGEIKSASPETKVGLVTTYHFARDFGALDIITTLAPEVDIIGYTVHPYTDDYNYSDVSRGLQYLNEVPDVVPGMPFAIVETGWNSSELLDSSEELQAEFVRDFFTFAETGGAEFIIWFSLHDQDDCSEAAATHLEPLPHLQEDEEYVRAFEEFMCTFGLKNSDGTPKQAWHIWREYLE